MKKVNQNNKYELFLKKWHNKNQEFKMQKIKIILNNISYKKQLLKEINQKKN